MNTLARISASILLTCGMLAAASADIDPSIQTLARDFVHPPDSARPWVYWFWVNGSISPEGITADLEAMQRAGIGGCIIMEVGYYAPGPVAFGHQEWRRLFHHAVVEAHRLGIELNMNNDCGWTGSGGPWITPELSMQRLAWTVTQASGGRRLDVVLPEPDSRVGVWQWPAPKPNASGDTPPNPRIEHFYRDVAVVAYRTPRPYQLDSFEFKTLRRSRHDLTQRTDYETPAGVAVPRGGVLDLTQHMDADGRLVWTAPAGDWTILRLGHVSTGANNAPSPLSGRGLECDKLSKQAMDAFFDGFLAHIIADSTDLVGKTLVATHIDSWEVGSQNWTENMRQEFQRLRGYDPWPYLPAMAGQIIDSVETTERFLWDLRMTVSELIRENYSGQLRRLAQAHGMRLSMEAYDGAPLDEMDFAATADEPMAEFWTDSQGINYSELEMGSAARTNGRRIVGAEAFTSRDGERWLLHPANIKSLGDWAFCQGINRFVIHRFTHQPWTGVRPGMMMGPWGLHYEGTQTWWDESAAWHTYVTRCQYLLRQGPMSADICYLSSEDSPQRFPPPGHSSSRLLERPKYNYDACTARVVVERMSVVGGRLMLPDGANYRLLVVPENRLMTPRLLAKVKSLVAAGATVLGPKPMRSPSLSGYPECDRQVRQMADELWGASDPGDAQRHPYGKGWVFWDRTPEEVLAGMGVPPDFDYATESREASLRYIHKILEDGDIYFVANKTNHPEEAVCAFRVDGKRPELWWPESGRMQQPAACQVMEGTLQMPLRLGPTESVFVVFRADHEAAFDPVQVATCDGKRLFDLRLPMVASEGAGDTTNTFTVAVWAKPKTTIDVPKESDHGPEGVALRRNDALYPPPGHEVYSEERQAGSGISIGRNGVVVYEHSANYFAPILAYAATLDGWTHVAVAYRDGRPTLYLNGKRVHEGSQSRYTVHSGVGVAHERNVAPFNGELGQFRQVNRALDATEIAQWMKSMPTPDTQPESPKLTITSNGKGGLEVEAWKAGNYELTTADGKQQRFQVAALPEPLEIGGPWAVQFEPNLGAPERATFAQLMSWTDSDVPGIRYFSGHASYLRKIDVPSPMIGRGRRVYLDLGRVEVMADVTLNGKPLGIAWKPPYRYDVTDAIKAGANALEIRVVNLWPNRLIGDEQKPEDTERDPSGWTRQWPEWLLEGKPSPTGRITFASWKLWRKDDPLQESGLLGPVTLFASVREELR